MNNIWYQHSNIENEDFQDGDRELLHTNIPPLIHYKGPKMICNPDVAIFSVVKDFWII